ncbi:hypothetical protein DW090_01560 [Olsenella sp. AM05-17]|nr:hypothetical protein DW090_01560 [Olsenella sp. AM05-17]
MTKFEWSASSSAGTTTLLWRTPENLGSRSSVSCRVPMGSRTDHLVPTQTTAHPCLRLDSQSFATLAFSFSMRASLMASS